METTPTTQLDKFFGEAEAKACLQEIEDRIHPCDSFELHSALIRDILERHIYNRNIPLDTLLGFFPERCECLCGELRESLIDRTFGEVRRNYPTDMKQRMERIRNE